MHWVLVDTPFVASMLQEVFKTQFYLCIAMEFCDGGDLSQYIDNRTHHRVFGLPESQARWLFQQLMVAVDYCHRLGIVNRDIKVLAGQCISLDHWCCAVIAPSRFGTSPAEPSLTISPDLNQPCVLHVCSDPALLLG